MHRTVVVRFENCEEINVNDEIGLTADSSLTIREHLEDLAGDGLAVIAQQGGAYVLSDKSTLILVERMEPIELDALDAETRSMLQEACAAQEASQLAWAAACLPC